MITVKIKENLSGYTVDGHADYAEHGRDIICSAVSAVTQTALIGIEAHGISATSKQESGLLDVTLDEIGLSKLYADVILVTMIEGIREIAKQYPKYVKLEESTWELTK